MTSPDDDPFLILVDALGRRVGHERKSACHDGEGLLHRAFSVLLFDAHGRVLLQQRAAGKRLWPGFWSNACCGHPVEGEDLDAAARRRVHEELGVRVSVEFAFEHSYALRFGEVGSEREYCGVFFGALGDGRLDPAPSEVAELRWMDAAGLDRELAAMPGRYTPWFHLLWERARGSEAERLERWIAPH